MQLLLDFISKQVALVGSFFSTDEPLYLPKGSIRAIIVLVATAVTAVGMYRGKAIPDWWIVLYTNVLYQYFGARGPIPATSKIGVVAPVSAAVPHGTTKS